MSESGDGGAAQRPPAERAAAIVDHAGEQVGRLAADLGHRLQVFIARAREEVDDIVAEAQGMRRHDEP